MVNCSSVHQFNIARPILVFVHSDCVPAVIEAGSSIGLTSDRIVVVGPHASLDYLCLDDLMHEGTSLPPFVDKPLRAGEAKGKIAFLAPSSGTTGTQKVRYIIPCNGPVSDSLLGARLLPSLTIM